jgi:hypothetical protein
MTRILLLAALASTAAFAGDSARPGVDVSVNGTKIGNASKINISTTGATGTKSGSSVTVTIPAGSSDGPLVQNSTGQLEVKGNPTDGSTAVAVKVTANTALANASARLLTIYNATTEKLWVDKTGAIHFPGIGVNVGATFMTANQRACWADSYGNNCASYLTWESDQFTIGANAHLGLSMGSNYFIYNGSSVPIRINNQQGLRIQPQSALQTCGSASAPEGTNIPITGGSGAYTKDCLCITDGTTSKWVNRLNPSDRTGTTTTCPAS